MVLHYYNPEELAAAEKVRAQMRRNTRPPALPQPVAALPAPATPPADPATRLKKLDDLLAQGLISEDERKRERQRILAEI